MSGLYAALPWRKCFKCTAAKATEPTFLYNGPLCLRVQGLGGMLGINVGVRKGLCRHYTRVIQGMYWDNGKENGNYYLGFRTMTMTLFQPNKIHTPNMCSRKPRRAYSQEYVPSKHLQTNWLLVSSPILKQHPETPSHQICLATLALQQPIQGLCCSAPSFGILPWVPTWR